MNNQFSVGVWNYGMGTDRYVGDGYKPYMPFEERVCAIAGLEGVTGIEVTYPNDVSEKNWAKIKALLDQCGLRIVCTGVELVCDKEWKTGSLSSMDPTVRKRSAELVKSAMDFAQMAGIPTVNLWLGQDGFDYVFQNNYAKSYGFLVDTLTQCAEYNPDINLALEYKTSEPRMSCMLKNAGMALAVCYATGAKNVGVTLDVGHSFNAGENPAETASILLAENRLFHIHLNDNYRIADDDMPVGSVHWPQYFEFFYWMEKLGYTGWYSLDQYPYRDLPHTACQASITFMQGALDFVRNKLPQDFVTGTDPVPGQKLLDLFQIFFGKGGKLP